MANWVRAMSELRTFAGIVTSGWGKAGRAGKLSLDIPTILYFLRSQRISTQLFSSSLKRISSSGSKRTSSSSFLAGMVPEPSFFTLASHPVRMLSSRSVAVIVRRLPFASQSRLDRMGMVVFRSTTPCVWPFAELPPPAVKHIRVDFKRPRHLGHRRPHFQTLKGGQLVLPCEPPSRQPMAYS